LTISGRNPRYSISPFQPPHTLTNLQFALKFARPFIIRKGAFCSNKVENLIVVIIILNVTANESGIPYQTFHIRSALNQKIPLVSYLVHLKSSFEALRLPNPHQNVELLWNWIVLLLLEAIPTVLLKKWAHLTPGMNLQIKELLKDEVQGSFALIFVYPYCDEREAIKIYTVA